MLSLPPRKLSTVDGQLMVSMLIQPTYAAEPVKQVPTMTVRLPG